LIEDKESEKKFHFWLTPRSNFLVVLLFIWNISYEKAVSYRIWHIGIRFMYQTLVSNMTQLLMLIQNIAILQFESLIKNKVFLDYNLKRLYILVKLL